MQKSAFLCSLCLPLGSHQKKSVMYFLTLQFTALLCTKLPAFRRVLLQSANEHCLLPYIGDHNTLMAKYIFSSMAKYMIWNDAGNHVILCGMTAMEISTYCPLILKFCISKQLIAILWSLRFVVCGCNGSQWVNLLLGIGWLGCVHGIYHWF